MQRSTNCNLKNSQSRNFILIVNDLVPSDETFFPSGSSYNLQLTGTKDANRPDGSLDGLCGGWLGGLMNFGQNGPLIIFIVTYKYINKRNALIPNIVHNIFYSY